MSITDVNYFDHSADIGIIGRWKTIEEAFVNAAEVLFVIMVEDLLQVREEQSISIEFQENDPEIVLVTWLNLLNEIVRDTEVKGARLTMLSVKKEKGLWEARCVVDI